MTVDALKIVMRVGLVVDLSSEHGGDVFAIEDAAGHVYFIEPGTREWWRVTAPAQYRIEWWSPGPHAGGAS